MIDVSQVVNKFLVSYSFAPLLECTGGLLLLLNNLWYHTWTSATHFWIYRFLFLKVSLFWLISYHYESKMHALTWVCFVRKNKIKKTWVCLFSSAGLWWHWLILCKLLMTCNLLLETQLLFVKHKFKCYYNLQVCLR